MSKVLLLGFIVSMGLAMGSGQAAEASPRLSVPLKLRSLSGGQLRPTTERVAQSIQGVEAQIQQRPDDPELHFLLALAYSRTPYVERTVYELEQAQRLLRRQPEALEAFARQVATLEQLQAQTPHQLSLLYRLAFRALVYAAALAPSSPDSRDLSRSSLYFDRAEESFRQLIALDPADFSARNYWGYVLMTCDSDKHYFAATRQWQHSLRLNERNPGAYFFLAQAALKKGNSKQSTLYSAQAVRSRNTWLEAVPTLSLEM